jgi:hypothetical protein
MAYTPRDTGHWRPGRLALLVLLDVVWLCGAGAPAQANPLAVTAEPIAVARHAPERTRVGPLTFLSGFALRSDDPRFGGLSGLALTGDGKVLYAVSDHGYGLSVPLQQAPDGRLTGFGTWTMSRLRDPQGKPLRHAMRDAEAVVRDPGGAFVVAFEGRPRLWRYPPATPPFTARPQVLPLPAELGQAPRNGGLEAVTRLSDGRWLLLTEEFANADGSLKGWVQHGNTFLPLAYQPFVGFRPTDLAALASGDVLVLERHYSVLRGLAARLLRLSPEHVRPGARLQGQEIARLEAPLTVDNFEGLAVHEAPQPGTLLYLVTDDNYRTLQRTLLLQFRLDPLPVRQQPAVPRVPSVRERR